MYVDFLRLEYQLTGYITCGISEIIVGAFWLYTSYCSGSYCGHGVLRGTCTTTFYRYSYHCVIRGTTMCLQATFTTVCLQAPLCFYRYIYDCVCTGTLTTVDLRIPLCVYRYMYHCISTCTTVYLQVPLCFYRYIYSGQILLSTDSVLGLLVLADKYNVPDLKQCCSEYMSRHLVSLTLLPRLLAKLSVVFYL